MARDTSTGSHYEGIIASCIERSCAKNGLMAKHQAQVGTKPGGGRHRVDWEIIDIANPEIRGLVSCKFQQTSGTAEEKIAYEVIKLLHTMESDLRYKHAWIVMGGVGWSTGMISFVENELAIWIPKLTGKVSIYTSTDSFVSVDVFSDVFHKSS